MANAAHQTPSAILLATDLSARCDRALDRAVLLAQQHKARLVILNVMAPGGLAQLGVPSWRKVDAEHRALAQRRVERELDGADVQVEVIVETGNAVETILKVAKEKQAGLIVTGIARDETLGRLILGTTVEKLVREASVPVLVVKHRARKAYSGALVATDFSEGSRQALLSARSVLGATPLTLFHAYDALQRRAAQNREHVLHGFRKAAEESATAFIAGTPGIALADKPKVEIEYGQPQDVLPDFAYRSNAEVLVTGTHGLTGILRTAIGSVADSLIQAAPCDVLVVRQHG